MRITAQWIRAGVVALACAGLVVVPTGASRWAANAAEPIRLGWVGPLSPPGDYAEGELMKDAAIMATDEVNGSGGVLGRPVQVFYEDTQGRPEQGTAAMERLFAQDHVIGVFGEFHSSVALAEIELAHIEGIPWVGVDVWANKITALGYPEVFRVAPTNALIVTKIADWLVAAGFKNIAVIQEKTDAGQNARETLTPILDAKGVHYDVVEADLNTTDFTAQILRFKSHTPPYDFFLTLFSGAGAYTAVSQASSVGFAPTPTTGIYNWGGPALDPTFWKNVRGAGVGLATENVGLPKKAWNKMTMAFVEGFHKRFGFDPSPQAMENYDAEMLLLEAVKSVGGTNSRAIIHALEQTSWVGLRGKYSFSLSHTPDWAYHQFMDAPVQIIQYDKIDESPLDAPIVWPRNLATVDYVYKKPGGQ
jgi:branched-chain amino acid transport system substrate-binding protein